MHDALREHPDAFQLPTRSPVDESSRTATTLHVDESIIPKLSRLGTDVVDAFGAFVDQAAHAIPLAAAVQPSAALDAKWQAYSLTSSVDVLTWQLAPGIVYVWDVVPADTTS